MRRSRAGEAASGAVKWRGLYFGDHLTDFQRARGAARALLAALESPSAPGTPLPPVGPALWCVTLSAADSPVPLLLSAPSHAAGTSGTPRTSSTRLRRPRTRSSTSTPTSPSPRTSLPARRGKRESQRDPALTAPPPPAARRFVRVNCDWDDIAAGTCTPTADGGVWVPGAGGRVTLQARHCALRVCL